MIFKRKKSGPLEAELLRIYRADFSSEPPADLRDVLMHELLELPSTESLPEAVTLLESSLKTQYSRELSLEPAPELRSQLLSALELEQKAESRSILEEAVQSAYSREWDHAPLEQTKKDLLAKLPARRPASVAVEDGFFANLAESFGMLARISVPVAAIMLFTLWRIGLLPEHELNRIHDMSIFDEQ